MTMAEQWAEVGDVNEWGSVTVPDSPEGIHDTPPKPEPGESKRRDDQAATHLGQTVAKYLVPVGAQQLGPEQYIG